MDRAAQYVINNIITRRSVRSYLEQQITDESLKTILTCGLYAPTGGNCQYSRFIVLQQPEVLAQLNDLIRDSLMGMELREGQWRNKGIIRARKAGYHFIYHAPTLITAVSVRTHKNSMANCANALENMQLAAWALGLGACWSNQPYWLTGHPAIRTFFHRYGLRDDEDIFGSVGVGYSNQWSDQRPERKAGRIELDIPRDIGF